ncbi:MAG TPA: hypothetical protein PLH23_19255 [Hyphomonadaceae bacterium]|nr:hypothetical protein [Hyphomonadaceae bacterium]HPI50418.1 hypothetical protein [Hyphomonadaceae bacterium]
MGDDRNLPTYAGADRTQDRLHGANVAVEDFGIGTSARTDWQEMAINGIQVLKGVTDAAAVSTEDGGKPSKPRWMQFCLPMRP